jgi:hypothetical protein
MRRKSLSQHKNLRMRLNCKGRMMTKGKDWIQEAKAKGDIKKGALREKLGVKEGQNIPAKKLAKAAKSSDPKTRKQAALAKTFKKMKKD